MGFEIIEIKLLILEAPERFSWEMTRKMVRLSFLRYAVRAPTQAFAFQVNEKVLPIHPRSMEKSGNRDLAALAKR